MFLSKVQLKWADFDFLDLCFTFFSNWSSLYICSVISLTSRTIFFLCIEHGFHASRVFSFCLILNELRFQFLILDFVSFGFIIQLFGIVSFKLNSWQSLDLYLTFSILYQISLFKVWLSFLFIFDSKSELFIGLYSLIFLYWLRSMLLFWLGSILHFEKFYVWDLLCPLEGFFCRLRA